MLGGFAVTYTGHPHQREFYVTILPDPLASGAREEARSVYTKLATFLRERRATLVQERIYGRCEASETILGVRRDLVGDVPATFVEGVPCQTGVLAGVHAYAVIPSSEVKVETILWEGVARGRRVEIEGTTFIYLSGINGLGAGGAPAQARKMFRVAQQLLEQQGASLRSVVRTWVYMPNLLDWYSEFNGARNEIFRAAGLLGDGMVAWLPASTGIQARNTLGVECLMDVLAVLPGTTKDTAVRMAVNPLQKEPLTYGSAFSRGVLIDDGDVSRLYISGTASIDKDGVTSHPNDVATQIRTTLRIIDRLLADHGMSFVDICHATVFLKSPREVEKLHDLLAATDVPAFPFVCVQADVCRKELLFEMDAQAILCHDVALRPLVRPAESPGGARPS